MNGCLLFLFLLIVPPGATRGAQDAARPQVPTPEPIRVNVDLVVLHASVQNRSRTAVSGLRKEDFEVYEEQVRQDIVSFSREDIPVTVGLVVDNSGSMGPKYSEVVTAALTFARSSHPQDELFVVYFNEKVFFGLPAETPFTDKASELRAALAGIKADGMTALYDAMAAALGHLNNGKWEKKVLIVLSDGADNASKFDLNRILTMATQSEAIIYTVALFEQGDPDGNPRVLKRIAKATGGEAFLPESVKNIVAISEQIARDIRSQYTLTYIPTNPRQDGSFRKIQVKAKTPEYGRLTVRTRAGYYARQQSAPAARQP